MPNYDYKCDACGHEFEQNTPLADYDKTQVCKACVTEAAQRTLTKAPGQSFRGGGWTPKFS